MRKLQGYVLCSVPFLAIYGIVAYTDGIRKATFIATVYLVGAFVCGCLWVGVKIINEKEVDK